MKDLRDRMALIVIDEWTQILENDPPLFEKDMFESLERSFMRIGKLLTDELEREQDEKERSVSGQILQSHGIR